MDSIGFIFFAFFCGSLPFSVWAGKLLLNRDVRQIGDGNPGAVNAFKTGNRLVGLLVLILDISKGAAPVGLAYFTLNMRGPAMYLISIAPILGHVFSPFLGFKGGKGIATTLGVWIGLTLWKVPLTAVPAALIGNALFMPPGWSVMIALGAILATLVIRAPDPLLLLVWFSQSLILSWTHRDDLRCGIHLRPWLSRTIQRK